MKFLAFAFVVVFIPGEYGTIHATPIDAYEPEQQVALFKKYAVDFMDAAMKPLLADQKTVEGACECLPIVEQEQNIHPLHVKLATMSIVKDYYEDFQMIVNTSESNLSTIVPIKAGLMKNIRTILVILGKPIKDYPRINLSDTITTYLSKIKGTSEYDESLKSALKCYGAMYSLHSKCFHRQFTTGFQLVSRLLVAHEKGLDDHPDTEKASAELEDITEEISECELNTIPDPDSLEDVVEEFRLSLIADTQ